MVRIPARYGDASSLSALCGVDEAGRGPWAGPVVAAAVILNPLDLPQGLDDSKKLTHSQREHLFDVIQDKALCFGVALVDAPTIDGINILAATHLAMRQAVDGLTVPPRLALIDGNRAPDLGLVQTVCLVGGDALSLSIAAASILAKVTRDRWMVQAARDHPGYGFELHKGYGVPAHRKALEALGPCPLHRMSFKPIRALSES
jgi:ribonuclease HII